MSEENKTKGAGSSAASGDGKGGFGVPVAIVIAGGLIAMAIYYGGGSGVLPSAQPQEAREALPAEIEQPTAPKVPTVDDIRPVTEEDNIRGNANAKITIIEYSDFECPFCKRFHPTMQQVMDEYPNDVRWVYRHFPLEQLHSQAIAESVAAECAGEQGKFWEMTDKIYEVTPSNDGLDLTTLPTLAQQAGVTDKSAFEACLESGKFDEQIQADIADAAAAGGRGTPYSVVISADGQVTPVSGAQPFAALKAAIDQYLN